MSLLRNIGLYSAEKLSRPGAQTALANTARATSESVARLGGAKPFDIYNRAKPGDIPFVPIPLIPDTADITSFLNVKQLGTPYDLTATLTVDAVLSSLYAMIQGTGSSTYDMACILYSWHEVSGDFYASIIGRTSTHTKAHEYDYTILSTPSGVSILTRFLTNMPDLYAQIYGWESSDLEATLNVVSTHTHDLYAIIGTVGAVSEDITAYLGARHIEDITASITSITPKELLAYITSVSGEDITASLTSIPYVALNAISGGHYPEDLSAQLIPSPPKDLSALLRAGLSGVSDLQATLTAQGYYNQLPAYIRGVIRDSSKLKATLIVRVPNDLPAFIHGRAQSDITAYIKGVNELNMLCRIVAWAREVETDLVAFVRAGWADTKSIPVYIHGVISTHTSNKPVSFHKLSRPFNSFLLGSASGLSFVTLEPVWGNFPDLLASIVGDPLSINDMRAFLRVATIGTSDIGASVVAVTKSITINKIPINFVNVSDLSVYISAFSGYKELNASVFGWKSESTNTAVNSGWVYVSSTLKFYLGTDKGLFIPGNIVSAIRPDRFVNYSSTPDLWGHIHGWGEASLSAYIAVQPYLSLQAYLTGQDLSHVASLSGYIGVMYTSDLNASVAAAGSYSDMPVYLVSDGQVSDLSATIRPYLKVLGYRVIPVETKPLSDLRAVLNPIASCGYVTTYDNINAFIRGTVKPPGGSDLVAYLNVLSNIEDISAEIIGRKITRIKLSNLMFRAQTRSSGSFGATIVGEAWSTNDMVASIVPLHHVSDLTASITPYYPTTTYRRHDTENVIDVYKLVNQNAELHKQVSMAFDSKVESYIYDSLQKSLYTIGDDKWVINFSELSETGEFFDKDITDKTYLLDNIAEYDSIDEAIRAAIVWLTEPQSYDMTATITAVGGHSGIGAIIEGLYADRVKDLVSSLYIVSNDPSLSAFISAYSGYGPMSAYVRGWGTMSPELSASVSGVVYSGLSASINGIT